MKTKLKAHRALSLLQSQYNESFLQVPNAGMQFFLILLIVLGNYGTIRLVNRIHIAAYLFFPWVALYMSAALFGACILASRIYALSSHFVNLRLDKKKLENQVELEFVKEKLREVVLELQSLKPLEFKISRFFPIRKYTLMIMMFWIHTHTVNMFLASS